MILIGVSVIGLFVSLGIKSRETVQTKKPFGITKRFRKHLLSGTFSSFRIFYLQEKRECKWLRVPIKFGADIVIR